MRVYERLYRIYYAVGTAQFDLTTSALTGYLHVQDVVASMLTALTISKPSVRIDVDSSLAHSPHPTYTQQLASGSMDRERSKPVQQVDASRATSMQEERMVSGGLM